MHAFITGASGWIGSAIARELVATGHQVTGLVRSETNAARLTALGATPVLGSLDDLDLLRSEAAKADGVAHTAFGTDLSQIVGMSRQERQIIELFGDVYRVFPRAPEQSTAMLADQGVRATVVRMPRSVHGRGETHGWMPMLARMARDKGVSAYVEEGDNLWPSVHRLDAAHAFCLALLRGAEGGPFHAVADEGVPYRLIAEAIGRQMGVPPRSLTLEEADAHFGALAMFMSGNGPASSRITRQRLGWEPTQVDLLTDVDHPEYFSGL